jgi:hypothetical protein
MIDQTYGHLITGADVHELELLDPSIRGLLDRLDTYWTRRPLPMLLSGCPTDAKCPMGTGHSGGTGATGLEPATSGVTGRRSNQLSYAPERVGMASVATDGGRLPPPRPGVRRGGGCASPTTPP